MPVLSTIVNGITEAVDTCVKTIKMKKGYKMTRIPAFPKVMGQAESFEVVTSTKGGRRLGLTLANESFDKVCPESLDFIRQRLRFWFAKYDGIMEYLEKPFPKNTIAVSYGDAYFQVGDSCAKFKEVNGAEGWLSYQNVSPNFLVTYFNKDDISFLAGITYFPSLYGKAKCYRSDRAGIYVATGSIESYPLDDRTKCERMTKLKIYGRFCSLAKKRVLVDASRKYVRHVEFDPIWKIYKYTECQECIVDSVTYKWKKTPEVDPSIKIAKQLQDLADNGTEISGTVKVFDTKGCLFTPEKRIVDLEKFMEENPSFNVHSKHAFIAKMVLGEEFKDRIGGEPAEEVEDAEESKPTTVIKATESLQVTEAAKPVEVAEIAEPEKRAISDDEAEPTKQEAFRTCGGSPTPSDSEIERLIQAKSSEENNVSDEEESSDESEDSENSDTSDAEDFERCEETSAEFDSEVDAEIVN
uniref:DUF4743 domain-containing protein n=1 Tax=Caenorhabditis tropicalis TaxID=1561998 RepID=A0A1I7TBM8_9PELO